LRASAAFLIFSSASDASGMPVPAQPSMIIRQLTHRAFLAVVFAAVACAVRAAPDLQAQEQAEKCNKLVEKQFRERRGSGAADGGTLRSRFESHYNRKRSKCFFLEVVTGTVVDKTNEKPSTVEIQALWNANENLQYGWFKQLDSLAGSQSECFLQKTVCRGREEWQRLIRPFLEE
jgi:hypothetical protein